MVSFDSTQLAGWLSMYFWPLLRILALISTAPITSEKSVPNRVKLGLGMMITFLIAPSLPPVDTPIFSTPALWLAMQQIMIGTALGITMQLAFAAIRMAGEIMGLQMGISFATFYDPSNRLNTPLLAQFLNLLAVLLFLTFNAHLWLISLLADSFHTLPISPNPVNAEGFMAVAKAGSIVFSGGMMLALPIVTLLLTLNMALGLLNRVTPQLSVFVIGFPLTLSIGILAIGLMMPMLAPFSEHLFSEILDKIVLIVNQMAME
ncbi:flagellar biosynthetic protein FliR [Rahnella ecdela]|jgi:flagellar biosynthetic protein FliR|uniref:Flagellar biosynthetic protein FliR n=1 Tax=Rahnella ecdela TaxID=2816250 RepID=A0ABS6LKC9_9GAMM|nr:flagellar biosynthetic protein FliR [Rahnella ecdela]MBU9847394.1 flagellar type III secretion system protein FliR [Rahnella ecdela]